GVAALGTPRRLAGARLACRAARRGFAQGREQVPVVFLGGGLGCCFGCHASHASTGGERITPCDYATVRGRAMIFTPFASGKLFAVSYGRSIPSIQFDAVAWPLARQIIAKSCCQDFKPWPQPRGARPHVRFQPPVECAVVPPPRHPRAPSH